MNYQEKQWAGKFGSDYTYRNPMSISEMDELYKRYKGKITRTKLNKEFLKGISRKSKVLEVGCNMGTQLALLQQIGFKNLTGIEINREAVELSKKYRKNIDIIQGSALDLPFKDNYFDLVFTSGLLMHISPKEVKKAIREIYRVSRKYIWELDYYAPKLTAITYRGSNKMVWKGDYLKMFQKEYKNIKVLKRKELKYKDSENIDLMFLLEK